MVGWLFFISRMSTLKTLCPIAFAALASLLPLAAFADAPSGQILAAVPTASPAGDAASPAPAARPAPAASAKPKSSPLVLSGYARAFDFDRLNQTQNAANPNRTAFNLGGLLKLDYRILDSPFDIGAGYYGDYPLGVNGLKPGLNSKIDNSLPGYSLSTVGQLYLKYATSGVRAIVGDILYNAAWIPSSDSRMKPALYQGADVNVSLTPQLSVGASRLTAFENRNQSAFERQTLLSTKPSAGAVDGNIAYKMPNDFVNLQYYGFYDYANLAYVEGGLILAPTSIYKPTLSAQYANEQQAGTAIAGKIDNDTFGVKLAANMTKNVVASFGYDDAPWRYTTVAASSLTKAETGIFLPGGGTPIGAAVGTGLYRIAYGGIASPYSDSYATDPLYTTSISQGVVDRRSAGSSFKGTITYTSDNKRVIALLSEAYYNYGNQFGSNNTNETDVDVTYRFMKVKAAGPYRGLSLRERFADRSQDTLPYEFKYVRTQLEYDL
jgi:hypothetical protein